MQIELRKDDSLSQRFLRLCEFFEGASVLLQEEETRLAKRNLFFESHLNKHFAAKKPLALTYMKSKQLNNSSDQNSISTQSTTSKPPSSVALEETIMFAIQQAENTLENVRKEELNPTTTTISKHQRPGINSPYDKPPTDLKKASTRMDQTKATNSRNEPAEIKKKPVLGKYVLHKLPTMQTTYNTTYTTAKTSVQSGRNSSAASRVTASTASSNNKSVNATVNTQKTQPSQKQIIPNKLPQPQQLQPFQAAQIQQKEQIDSRQALPRISKETAIKIPQSSSSTSIQPQQGAKESELPSNQTPSMKDSQSVLLEEFGGGSDLLELLDKDGLDVYYQAKKRAAKAEKEYVEQVKYFREKEHKAKKRFLTKLSEHWAQRKIVEANRIIVYNEKLQNDEEFPVDLRIEYEDQHNCERNEDNAAEMGLEGEQEQLLIDDLRNLSKYANLIKYNLQPANIEMQLLQQSFDSTTTTVKKNSKLSLQDQFRLWYFLKNLQSNIELFQKQTHVSMKEYKTLLVQHKQKIRDFLSFSETTKISQFQNDNHTNNSSSNAFTLLLCGLHKNNELPVSANKSTTITINPQKLQSNKDSINHSHPSNPHEIKTLSLPSTAAVRINQLQLKIVFLEFTQALLLQDLQEALLRNLKAPKISVKSLQSHLSLLRSIISLVNYNGKRFPAFFFTENVEQYFENISQ